MHKSSVWSKLQEIEDPTLKSLALKLPDTVLKGRADSTTTKYLYAYGRWRRWADEHNVPTGLPVSEIYLVLYLQYLGDTQGSRSAVETAVNCIAWAHEMAGYPPISGVPIVAATLKGLQRLLAKPTTKKEPITPVMLQAIVSSLAKPPSLSEVRLAAVALLAYAAFLRYEELAKLRCCDVNFYPDCLTVCITSSKTDQYREGAKLTVARMGLATCPVAMLEKYFALAELEYSSQEKLFRANMVTKAGERLRQSGSISYSRLRELLLNKLQDLGYDKWSFSLHSLRAGGATAAANSGVNERLFKRHGRWRSESAKDGYVKDSLEARLSVTKNIGL